MLETQVRELQEKYSSISYANESLKTENIELKQKFEVFVNFLVYAHYKRMETRYEEKSAQKRVLDGLYGSIKGPELH